MNYILPDILAALSSGIQMEIASYLFYFEASKKADDDNLRETLQQLAREEKKHFQILDSHYNSLIQSKKWLSIEDIFKQENLPEINENVTTEYIELLENIAKIRNDHEILEMAQRLEEDALDTYQDAANRSESKQTREMFKQLAHFEENHIKQINDELNSLNN